MAQVKDNNLSRVISHEHDAANRLMQVKQMEGATHLYTSTLGYDIYNNLNSFKERVASTNYETTYAYDNGNRPTTVQFGDANNKVGYGYDSVGRVSTRTLTLGGTNRTSTYGFVAGGHGTGSTTALISSITQTGQNFSYTYDNVGNIATEVRGSYSTSYVYDKLGQLLRVNDQRAGTTWAYEYDRGGNILNKNRYAYTTGALGTVLETILYEYDANWKDKLAYYNGTAISYDAIGNPMDDGIWAYIWKAGRQLESMTKTGTTATFAYNADGLRVRKTVNGAVTDYTLHGKQVVHLKQGGNNLHFFYDAQGRPAIVEFASVKYGYVHNLQGDIVAIIDGSGTQVVEYTYDAWGKMLTKTGTLATTLGTLNPFRYRGYVYDEETGLYYLRSRYYNPVWGRFVNADTVLGGIGQLFAHNALVYCCNSPIKYCDPNGHEPVTAVVTGAITLLLKVIIAATAGYAIGDAISAVPQSPTAASTSGDVVARPESMQYTGTRELTDVEQSDDMTGGKYYIAYRGSDDYIYRQKHAMSYIEAMMYLGCVETIPRLFKQYGKTRAGVYTENQGDAKLLAVTFSNFDPPEVHGINYLGHYHIDDHFHIWFGNPIP